MQTIPKGHRQIRNEILNDINLIWEKIEMLEKKSKRFLGESDPTSEALGYAAVHLMNTSFDVNGHFLASTNKLKPKSLNYLLEVLASIMWSGPKSRHNIHEAYTFAAKSVKKKYGLTKNTISDGCGRRLGFTGKGATEKFINEVEGWLFRNENGLRNLIKEHTNQSLHQKIDTFFNAGGKVQ